jgi:predicted Zn-dependent protease
MAAGDDWDDTERDALEPFAREVTHIRERHRHDPPLDVLRAARAGVLPDDLQQKADAHLESSPWSRTLVDGADEAEPTLDPASVDRLLARIENDRRPAMDNRRPTWKWALALGSLAAAVAVAVIVWRQSSKPIEPRSTTTQTAQISAAPARPAFALQLTPPEIKMTPAVLLRRGEDTSQFVDDVAPALNAFRAGDYDAAARRFDALRAKYSSSVEVPFYLGVSRLFLDDAPAAARSLESARALNDQSFDDDVMWYLAVAYERSGERTRAAALVDGLCRGQSPYASRACAAATTLREAR